MQKKMTKPITPAQRKRIVAEYINCNSYAQVAKHYGISDHTVKKIVGQDTAFAEKCESKKIQDEQDIYTFLDSRKEEVYGILSGFLSAMADKGKLETATLSQLSTAFGTVIDKYTGVKEYLSGDKAAKDQLTQLVDALNKAAK